MNEENKQTTAFNMSIATLERIDELYRFNNECSLKTNIRGWLLGLQTLLLEVSPMMDETEEEEFEKLYQKINYIDKPTTVNEQNSNFEQRKTIQKADSFLRRILWNKGLTMTRKDDIEKMML